MIERILPVNEIQFQDPDLKATRDKLFSGRFMCQGKSVNICTGILTGGNIIYQIFYWDRPRNWFKKILQYLQFNNPKETIRIDLQSTKE